MRVSFIVSFVLCIGLWPALSDTCRPGYMPADPEKIYPSTLIGSFAGDCGVNSGYSPVVIVDEIAYPALSNHTTCTAGQRYDNGVCVNNTRGECADGYLDTELNDYWSFIQSNAGTCITGYQALGTIQDVSYLTGRVVNSDKCAVGSYPGGDGCIVSPVDDCPNSYYSVVTGSTYKRANADNECGTNYSAYGDIDICLLHAVQNTPDLCTPQLLCPGMAGLRSSNGMNLTLYGENVTNPSMAFGLPNGNVCYINLLYGVGGNTINVNYNNETYHGVN